jgi:hypothetical protein
MHIPGFTAGTSLYTPVRRYWTGSGIEGSTEKAVMTVMGIVPQQNPICRGNWCCDEWGNCIYKGKRFQ